MNKANEQIIKRFNKLLSSSTSMPLELMTSVIHDELKSHIPMFDIKKLPDSSKWLIRQLADALLETMVERKSKP